MPQHLMPLWSLSGSEAGLMASAFAFGYMLAVPLLTTLTDRVDARGILLAGSALSALATLAFGALADGLGRQLRFGGSQASALPVPICQASRRAPTACPPGDASRSITLYTSSFSFGVGISFLVSQLVADSSDGAWPSW
jgi:predicted MFS family arabinose efflux permease